MAENKGKPSGGVAEKKNEPGGRLRGSMTKDQKDKESMRPAGRNRPEDETGGPEHRGGRARKDRNS